MANWSVHACQKLHQAIGEKGMERVLQGETEGEGGSWRRNVRCRSTVLPWLVPADRGAAGGQGAGAGGGPGRWFGRSSCQQILQRSGRKARRCRKRGGSGRRGLVQRARGDLSGKGAKPSPFEARCLLQPRRARQLARAAEWPAAGLGTQRARTERRGIRTRAQGEQGAGVAAVGRA